MLGADFPEKSVTLVYVYTQRGAGMKVSYIHPSVPGHAVGSDETRTGCLGTGQVIDLWLIHSTSPIRSTSIGVRRGFHKKKPGRVLLRPRP